MILRRLTGICPFFFLSAAASLPLWGNQLLQLMPLEGHESTLSHKGDSDMRLEA